MNAPTKGYILPEGYGSYRATALAYMQRENKMFVENVDGKTYTIDQLKNSIINYHGKNTQHLVQTND